MTFTKTQCGTILYQKSELTLTTTCSLLIKTYLTSNLNICSLGNIYGTMGKDIEHLTFQQIAMNIFSTVIPIEDTEQLYWVLFIAINDTKDILNLTLSRNLVITLVWEELSCTFIKLHFIKCFKEFISIDIGWIRKLTTHNSSAITWNNILQRKLFNN